MYQVSDGEPFRTRVPKPQCIINLFISKCQHCKALRCAASKQCCNNTLESPHCPPCAVEISPQNLKGNGVASKGAPFPHLRRLGGMQERVCLLRCPSFPAQKAGMYVERVCLFRCPPCQSQKGERYVERACPVGVSLFSHPRKLGITRCLCTSHELLDLFVPSALHMACHLHLLLCSACASSGCLCYPLPDLRAFFTPPRPVITGVPCSKIHLAAS